MGKEVAKDFLKYFGQLERVIEELLDYTELNIDFVYDQLVGGMMKFGVPRPAATLIAHGIKLGMDLFVLP